jgi:SAM-dependent MidA family methyltransferase
MKRNCKRVAVLAEEKIIERIKEEGPLSFHDFMEIALYDHAAGYNTSPAEKIGSNGDYYTSAYLTEIFAAMIGKQLEEMWQIMNKQDFAIIEYGAGVGLLCSDILGYLKNNSPLYDHLTYYIIEKSPAMIEKEKTVLAGKDDKVRWINSIADVSGISGCVLSNEVVDNFAVHQVVMKDELMELFVDYNGKFIERLQPASEALKDYLQSFNIQLSKSYRTEINLEAENWIKEIANALQKGFVLTIDYGHTANEFYSNQRSSGTLLCYYKHTINDDPFQHIGEQDITTHVNFSALMEAGSQEGLNYCGFTNQSNFLLSLGLVNYLRQVEEAAKKPIDCSHVSLHKLLFEMGRKIKVLIQEKGVGKVSLSGMKFPLQIV